MLFVSFKQITRIKVKDTINEAKRVIGDFNDYRYTLTDDVGQLEHYIDTIREKVQNLNYQRN
ncbi:hypothetical protein ACFQ4A_14355 [Lentibacillus salinarum]|uniref:DUF1657 domain-containing protein n=1 Tax=Lentibacillus salinarum TaxID=446820 RepID=A0ABW3ZX74_9BACI